jgi:hypothetical protein
MGVSIDTSGGGNNDLMAAIVSGGPEFVQRLQDFAAAKAAADASLAALADAQAVLAKAEARMASVEIRELAVREREVEVNRKWDKITKSAKILEML